MASENNNGNNNWKLSFYGLVVFSVICFWFSIDSCNRHKKDSEKFFGKFLKDSIELVERTNQLGQITVTAEAFALSQEQINKYVSENDELKKKLANSYKDIKTVYVTRTVVKIDSIKITTKDTIPCDDFELSEKVTDRFYALDFKLKNKKGQLPDIGIFNLTVPDTATTVIGTKKSGFLKLKRTLVAEQVHSNPYVKVQSMNTIVKADAKPRTLRKVAVGIAIGLVGGYLLFNK